MAGLPLVLGLAGLESCSCQPQIPDPGDTTHHDTSTDTATNHTGDTGPVKPCDVPEVEPNDSIDTPNALPMEKQGCGLIGQAGDPDYWSFTMPHDSWLEVKVNHSNGSIADMSFLLEPSDHAWVALRPNDPESLDSTLIFPASAGDYKLGVSEQTGKGGDRYGYDVLVSEAKPPVEFTRTETEPDDDDHRDPDRPRRPDLRHDGRQRRARGLRLVRDHDPARAPHALHRGGRVRRGLERRPHRLPVRHEPLQAAEGLQGPVRRRDELLRDDRRPHRR